MDLPFDQYPLNEESRIVTHSPVTGSTASSKDLTSNGQI
jgi:hypothetical protein